MPVSSEIESESAKVKKFFILKNMLSPGVGYSIDQFSNTMSVSSCVEKSCTDSSMLAHSYPKLTSENRCCVRKIVIKKHEIFLPCLLV